MKKIIKRIVSCVLFVAILLGLLQVSSLIFQQKSKIKGGWHSLSESKRYFQLNLKTVLTLYLSVTVRCIIRSFRSISGGITELPRMMFLLRLKSLCTQWNS